MALITLQDHPGLLDVCSKPECIELRSKTCHKTHACGHFCGGNIYELTSSDLPGLRAEKECLPCLNAECSKDSNQNADSFCNICWVESLGSAPSVKLDCGHVFHYHCIHKQVSALFQFVLTEQVSGKWSSANIAFGFLECPLCTAKIRHEGLDSKA